jgi:hypothetical protein
LRLALSKGLNRVGLFLSSPKDGNRSNFSKAVFSSYLEFWAMDKVHKPSDSECYTSTLEYFRIYLKILVAILFAKDSTSSLYCIVEDSSISSK